MRSQHNSLHLAVAGDDHYAGGSGGETNEEAGSSEYAAGRGTGAVRRRSSLAGGAHGGGAAEGGGRIAAGYGDERDAAGDRALRGGVAGSQPGVRSAGVASAAEKAGRFLRGPVPAAGRDEFRRFQPGGESGLPAAAQPAGARAETSGGGGAAGRGDRGADSRSEERRV